MMPRTDPRPPPTCDPPTAAVPGDGGGRPRPTSVAPGPPAADRPRRPPASAPAKAGLLALLVGCAAGGIPADAGGAPAVDPADPFEIVWARVDLGARSLGRGADREVLVGSWAGGALRLRCPAGVEPARAAILRAEDGLAGRVDGPFGRATRDGAWWVFPAAPDFGRWLLLAPGCAVEARSERASSAGLARLEHGVDRSELRRRISELSPFEPHEQAWLDASTDEDWGDRYRALRPAGPHDRGAAVLPPSQGGASLRRRAPGREDVEPWWVAAPRLDWAVQGPRRLRVLARPLGQGSVCLEIDGQQDCREADPASGATLIDGKLTASTWTEDGLDVGPELAWQVALPPGAHRVELTGSALGRVEATWTGEFGDPAPAAKVALLPPLEDPPEPSDPLPGLAPSEGAPAPLLLWSWSGAESPSGATTLRWRPASTLSDSGRAAGEWLDEDGRLQFWLPEEVDGACVLHLPGGVAFASVGEGGLHRFLRVGAGDVDAPPRFEGCDPLVRVRAAPDVPGESLLVRHHLPAGGRASWDLGDLPRALVLLSAPTDDPLRASLDVVDREGRSERWTVVAAPALPSGEELDRPPLRAARGGGAWTRPLALRLPEGARSATVWAGSALAVKVRGIELPPVPGAALAIDGPPPAPAPRTPEAALAAVRAASSRLAAAAGDEARGEALRERAEALVDLGAIGPAWRDLAWSDALGIAGAEDEGSLPERVRRARAEAARWGDWAPDGSSFVPIALDGAWEELARRAGGGDPLAVAVELSAQLDAGAVGPDPRPWWRAALRGGQILTGRQRLQAFVDAVRAGAGDAASASSPDWIELRAPTRWRTIELVRGSARAVSAAWPSPPPDPVDQALFGEEWPEDQRRALGGGWEIELPPASDPLPLPVRCRDTRVSGEVEACRFAVLDGRGHRIAESRAEPWGEPTRVDVPAHAGPVWLVVSPDEGVAAEALLPPAAPGEGGRRRVWSLRPGGSARVEVLGPTVLRLDVLASGSARLAARTPAGSFDLVLGAGPGSLLVPVPSPGPVVVELVASAPVLFAPYLRELGGSALPPSGDAPLLRGIAARLAGAGAAEAPSLPSLPPIPVPAARPSREHPGTVQLDVAFSTGEVQRDEVLVGTRWRPRWTGGGTVAARPFRAPVWFEAGARAVLAPEQGWAALGGGAVEARLGRGPLRGRVGADAELGVGSLGGGLAGVVRGSGFGRLDGFLAPSWQVLGQVRVRARGLLAGHEPAGSRWGEPAAFWSRFQSDHPVQIEPSAALRWMPGPWWRFELRGALVSNSAPDPMPLDGGNVEVGARWLRPGGWIEAAVGVDARAADAHRAVGYASPSIGVGTRWWLWPRLGLGLSIWAEVVGRPVEASVVGQLGLSVSLSRDRGLEDVRPGLRGGAHAADWFRDRSANRTSGVQRVRVDR